MEHYETIHLNIGHLFTHGLCKKKKKKKSSVSKIPFIIRHRFTLILNDKQFYLHNTLGKGMNPNILPPAMGK